MKYARILRFAVVFAAAGFALQVSAQSVGGRIQGGVGAGGSISLAAVAESGTFDVMGDLDALALRAKSLTGGASNGAAKDASVTAVWVVLRDILKCMGADLSKDCPPGSKSEMTVDFRGGGFFTAVFKIPGKSFVVNGKTETDGVRKFESEGVVSISAFGRNTDVEFEADQYSGGDIKFEIKRKLRTRVADIPAAGAK